MKPIYNPFTGDLQLINQDGAPGAGIVVKGAYNAETDYTVGDSVSYNGSSYVMYVEAVAGTVPTDTTKWQVVANKGSDGTNGTNGVDGIGITPQTIGFTLTGGTTPKTLTVALDGSVSGTNTGDQDMSGKVDKVAGKSLVSDTEISKIHALHADDQDLSGLVPTSRTINSKALSGNITLTQDDVGNGTTNKVFTATEQSKLSGIEASANNYTHPATHSADIITDGTTNKAYTATEQSKLAGIAIGANNYSLPTSSASVLGGIKVGTRLTITDGVLSADQQTANDFTTDFKNKLTGIATGAEVNVQSDWTQATNTADDYIKNKPTIPTALADLSEDSTHRIVTDTEKSTWNGKAAGDHTHTGVYATASHTQAASTITDFDTEVSNNSDVSANTSARHTHSNTTALNAVSGTNTGDQDLTSINSHLTNTDNPHSVTAAQLGVPRFRGTSATDPATPAEGDIYYNSTTNLIYLYANSVWRTISSTVQIGWGL